MHREEPISFLQFSAAPTFDVLFAIAIHHGCRELTVPQRHVRETDLVLGKCCKEVKWLDDSRERAAMLSHGMRDAPAYLVCLYDGGLSERVWFIAAVTEGRRDRSDVVRTLRVQHAPLQLVSPGEFTFARTMLVPSKMPLTAEAFVDRTATPRQRQSQI